MIATPVQLDVVEAPQIAVGCEAAAKLFGLSPRTWRAFDASGQIPRAIKLGGSKRWRYAELVAWAEAGCPSRTRWETVRSAAEVRR